MDSEMNVSVPKVMNAMQVAEYLGISKQGAYNLMNSGSFPFWFQQTDFWNGSSPTRITSRWKSDDDTMAFARIERLRR